MTEQWRDVAGYEGRYQVSSLGRVRSLARTVALSNGATRTISGRILKQSRGSHGYPIVALHKDGQSTRTVHALVADAFLGPGSPDLEVCHRDGDKANNAASNLRRDTRSGNNRDQVEHGTHPHAFKTHCPQGHEYTTENTYTYRGRRSCKACHKEACARYENRKRAAA